MKAPQRHPDRTEEIRVPALQSCEHPAAAHRNPLADDGTGSGRTDPLHLRFGDHGSGRGHSGPADHGGCRARCSATATGWSDGVWGDAAADSASTDAYGRTPPSGTPDRCTPSTQLMGGRGCGSTGTGRPSDHRDRVSVWLFGFGDQQPGARSGRRWEGDLRPRSVHRGQRAARSEGHLRARHLHGRHHRRPRHHQPVRRSGDCPAPVQLGVAPDAKLLAVKLATTDGSTDVSQVIAALDWVAEHPVMPDGTRIRVINLSYGTGSAQAYIADPLAAAAENAWRNGIVVVTSAGNDGTPDGRLTNPAIDPYVLAVAATDGGLKSNGWRGQGRQGVVLQSSATPAGALTSRRRGRRSSPCARPVPPSIPTIPRAGSPVTRPARCSAGAEPARRLRWSRARWRCCCRPTRR